MTPFNFSARKTATIVFIFLSTLVYSQGIISGKVMDKKNSEPLTGTAILIEGTSQGTTADIDGNFELSGIKAGKYTLRISYVSYQSKLITNVVVENGKINNQDIQLEEASLMLESVQVVAQKRTDTELSMLKNVRSAVQVVSGISSQQIGKTLDKDASEVVKRVPGVTIQDNRFIVVRGLNQRYNNVWLNNAATPSSETDVKAFSFDAIPSSMIDNLLIFKSGSPELPAEATGGFIKISTKNIPDENFLHIEYGTAYNDKTSFQENCLLPSQPLDYIGLGSIPRGVPSDMPADLNTLGIVARDAAALKLSNQWTAQQGMALPNQKFSLATGKKWMLDNGAKLGTITSLNYGNSYTTRPDMQNDAYERFDDIAESPVYATQYRADIYSNEFKIGLMHNWAYQNTRGTRIEFKNILNQVGVNKSSFSEGWNTNRQGTFKYFSNQYSARTTYSGQLSGNHQLDESNDTKMDWNLGFAYANRIEPDRQNRSLKLNTETNSYEYVLPNVPSINELGRLYMTNHEYVGTGGFNFEKKMELQDLKPTLKAGTYIEYKTRNFAERSITYRATNSSPYSNDDINALEFDALFTEPYLGQNKVLSVDEQTNIANRYDAQNALGAGYIALNLPLGSFNFYGGLRAEYNRIMLNGHYDVNSPVVVDNDTVNLFPSVNISYDITEKSLLRLAYASTINRPEFREISPLKYYDFNEKNTVSGNPLLKDAMIQNLDIRFEHYPSPTETFSAAIFYKKFTNPIEIVSVGASAFSFENALSAQNYGIEVEMKKSLEALIGLKNFALSVNASYIYSKVDFENTLTERSRALQGQSPYVLNTALFYQNDKIGLSTSLMYNVMGRRILVAAELNQGQVVIPDIYEIPRHVVDFSLNKKLGKHWELKLGVKDLLAQDFVTQQTYEYLKNGESKSATLTNKVYNLGRTVSLGASWRF